MSCCGSKREKYAQAVSNSLAQQPDETITPATMWTDVYFEYTGETALTVTGNVSGKRYRFNHPGEILLIDYRDASGMRGVPVLKHTSPPNP
jgi:hypothetical protein